MIRHSLLLGDAPVNFLQKKLIGMHDFLLSSAGGAWHEDEITVFPNGTSEEMLLLALKNLNLQKTEYILLYICAQNSLKDNEKTFKKRGSL